MSDHYKFHMRLPRNSAFALAVEALIAHPVAHFAMHNYHTRKDAKAGLK